MIEISFPLLSIVAIIYGGFVLVILELQKRI